MMKNVIRVAVAMGAMVLVGCSGKPLAANKEAAAGALFQSSRAASHSPGGGGLAQVFNSAVTTEVKVDCTKGGKVTWKFDVDTQQQSAGWDLAYDGCSWDGHTSMSGSLHMSYDAVTVGQTTLTMNLKGKVTFSGEVSDFVDADITEKVIISDLSAP